MGPRGTQQNFVISFDLGGKKVKETRPGVAGIKFYPTMTTFAYSSDSSIYVLFLYCNLPPQGSHSLHQKMLSLREIVLYILIFSG